MPLTTAGNLADGEAEDFDDAYEQCSLLLRARPDGDDAMTDYNERLAAWQAERPDDVTQINAWVQRMPQAADDTRDDWRTRKRKWKAEQAVRRTARERVATRIAEPYQQQGSWQSWADELIRQLTARIDDAINGNGEVIERVLERFMDMITEEAARASGRCERELRGKVDKMIESVERKYQAEIERLGGEIAQLHIRLKTC